MMYVLLCVSDYEDGGTYADYDELYGSRAAPGGDRRPPAAIASDILRPAGHMTETKRYVLFLFERRHSPEVR